MQHLRAKLQSEHGASILIALVFFLLCLTVGAVVLTAATANAGRLRDQRQAEQDYQTVSSAARYLRDVLSGKSFQAVTVTVNGGDGATTYFPPGGALSHTLEADAKAVWNRDAIRPKSRTFTVAVDGLEPVQAVLEMDDDYYLTVALHIQDESGAARSPLVVTVPAGSKTSSSTQRESTSIPVLDDSGNPVLNDDGTTRTEPHETVTVTETFTVTWGEGTIQKGAVS